VLVLMASPRLQWGLQTQCGGAGHGGDLRAMEREEVGCPSTRRAEPGTGRAKVSSKPWDWAQAHAIGCRFPGGASQEGASPT
jgi:hypothetical protein